MQKIGLILMASLLLGLVGISAGYAEDSQTPAAPPTPSAPDASQCTLKTDLPADMIAKCTEAMAKSDKNMLEGCCQEIEQKQP